MHDLQLLWEKCLAAITSNGSDPSAVFIFADSSLLMVNDRVAAFKVISDFKKDYIESYDVYKKAVLSYIAQYSDWKPSQIVVYSTQNQPYSPELLEKEINRVLMQGLPGGDALPQAEAVISSSDELSKADEADREPDFFSAGRSGEITTANKFSKYNLQFTFENFIVGSSNKFAYAASMVVADNPATKYNPLFIYGDSGLGKTHLLYAITHRLSQHNSSLNILYVKGEEFFNLLVGYMAEKRSASFREKFRTADVFLVDDVQFIAGKNTAQEEFFNTFNTLYESGKQIILTSDRPPKDISLLEDRLRSRFESGLICDIQRPDIDLRMAIIKRKAQDMGITVPNDALAYLADNITSNIRQIEGAIKKLNAYAFIHGSKITLELARESFADIITGNEPVNVTIEKILDRVSRKYSVTAEEIKGKIRTKNISRARHVAFYLIRTLTEQSLPAIGKTFGKDHSTVLVAINTIEGDMKADKAFEAEINQLIKEVKTNP